MDRYEYGCLYLVRVQAQKRRRQPAFDEVWAYARTGSNVAGQRCESDIAALNLLGQGGWIIDSGKQIATPEWISSAVLSEVEGAVIGGTTSEHFMRRRWHGEPQSG
ncbi:hypothetical protein GFH48_19040 [Streptomyces fagopyri]|uniref:Uncharacterized protein n=1 Tax=Streptomyces fagopyri TaxID=2662397 RepID=A0A5Q0LE13_9ACTN|nr:hypothetical protein [Streptomyces fagopyri]QFZ75084.1 hypothetical protein GFH48_19040 [Streptomyces fagopyri]